jgi:hypothetical protein
MLEWYRGNDLPFIYPMPFQYYFYWKAIGITWDTNLDFFPMLVAGLTNSAHFAEIHRNSTDLVRSEFKIRQNTVHEFKKSKNKKIRKICKKTR